MVKQNELLINKKIAHLSESEIEELMLRYYDGEPVSSLIKEYDIPTTPGTLYKTFPPVEVEELCPYCNNKVFEKRVSKSHIGKKEKVCIHCYHKIGVYCGCDNCKKARKKAEERNIRLKNIKYQEKKEEIERFHSYEPIPITKVDLVSKLYLSSILKENISEDFSFIQPLKNRNKPMFPTKDWTHDVLNSLCHEQLLVPDPSSDVEAFVDDENFPKIFYLYRVKYKMNVFGENAIQSLLYPSRDEFLNDKRMCLRIWKVISLHEVIDYLLYSMGKAGFSFNVGQKTYSVFKELLEHFSASQIYGIIYKQTANAVRYYHEQKVSKKRAASSIITRCENFGERALSLGWELTKYDRVSYLPQSHISSIFFNRILMIGDLGFYEKPNIETIEKEIHHNKATTPSF
ncbi:hypothetical protein [Virgibacillus halodenitrificans]|uniref:hypothetical protein n=1 Tax=Virgibacillus halodenitrificans TaxID=1482 RepID=UPI000EF513E5|nr:hypothetical protein [Virgibacillus halodenitrificans]